MKKRLSVIGMVLVAFMLVLIGCSPNQSGSSDPALEEVTTVEGESLSASGMIVLRINPEIAIEYDENGVVTRLVGRNDDGNEIVDTYNDYIGKESGVVLEELIALIDEAGYFVEEVEGEPRRVVLELESGSSLPEEDFLEMLTANVKHAVSNLNTEANVVNEETNEKKEAPKENKAEEQPKETATEQQPAEQPKAKEPAPKSKPKQTQNNTNNSEYIGMERAKEVALNHAGKNASQVHWDDLEFDFDDGVPHYEIEFDVGPNEYEYDIHAVTGKIIEFEQDLKAEKNQKNTSNQVPAEKQPTATKEISKDEAINIALKHAGLTRDQVVFDDVELEYEDGRKEWEVDFDHGNWEYEYEIDASTGNILDFEKDYDD